MQKQFDHIGNSLWITKLVFGEIKPPAYVRWVAFGMLTLMAVILVSKLRLIGIAGLVVLITVVPFVTSAFWNLRNGLIIMLFMAFFLSVFNRLYENIPVGIGIDAMIVVLVYGIVYRALDRRDWSTFKAPISVAILLWGGMNIIEIANPWAASRAAWFYVIRPAVGYMMLFFITYEYIKTKKDLVFLLKVFLVFCLFSAGWGIYQAFFGYFQWELNHVIAKDVVHLVFNNGRWRSIGPIGSPAQFGIISAFVCVFSFNLMTGFKGFAMRSFLFTVGVASLLAMVYSGTRSAYVILPIFFFGKVMISRSKKMYIALAAFIVLGIGFLYMPSNNYHIQRIQSIANASEDASYQVRAKNRKMILPWIAKHPIGGGLGSTGVWGQKFSPGTFLANFPPDSGLVRVAVELGWIGLIIFLNMYYHILIKGTKNYWKMNDKTLKAVVSSIIPGIAAMLVVEWGQEVVGVFPMSMLFWIIVAMMFRAIELDHSAQKKSGSLNAASQPS